MTSILKTPPIQRSEKKVQVNDNHRSTSGQIAFPPLPIMRDTQTALSPPPLPPPWMPGLELRTGPRWLYGAPGVITISLGFLFLCCVVLIAPAVVLVCQIGGELWNLMLNNHNYGICRQGQYHVDKGGGGGKEVKTWEMGTSYMTSGLKSTTTVHFYSRFVYIIPTQTPLYKHSPCCKWNIW